MYSSDLNKKDKLYLPPKTAFWAGFLYILTFVSVPTLFLYQSIHKPNYLLSNANYNIVVFGGILEIIKWYHFIYYSVFSFKKSKMKHLH